tara:strand:- start:550 stop:720 length:171 start_codon:yes stop_codon:yes gene_type:complete
MIKPRKDYKSIIQDYYRKGYEKAANGKWYYEEYWLMSHMERRKAYPQKRRKDYIGV